MSESTQHRRLVQLLLRESQNIVGKKCACFIQSDLGDGSILPPLTSEGFRPDVYFMFNGQLIIGEAKTENDVERLHSKSQYRSYLRKCSLFDGDALFLVAVPWQCRATIKNILNNMRKEFPGTYHIRIIEDLGGEL